MELDDIIKIIIFIVLPLITSVLRKKPKKGKAAGAPPSLRRRPPAPQRRPEAPAPAGTPAEVVAPRAPSRPSYRGHPVLDPILEEVDATLARYREEEGVRDLLPPIERGFAEPLRRISRTLDVHPDVIEAYQVYWNLVRLGLEQRVGRTEAPRVLIQELDALAGDAFVSITGAMSIGTRLPIQRLLPVLVHEGFRLPAYDLPPVPTTGIAPVPVPFGAHDEVWRWASLPHNVAHLVWEHHSGLQGEVARATKLAGRAPSVLGLGLISQQSLMRMLATSWLPEIFADIVTALALGPSAALGALFLFRGVPRGETTRIRLRTGGLGGLAYDPHPPPHLRFALILRVLSQGPYAEEAEAAWSAWTDEHGNPDELELELPGQFARPFPIDPFVEELDRVADRLLTMRFRTLGRRSLAELPGLVMPREEHLRLDRAARRRQPERALREPSARGIISYAVLSSHHHAISGAGPARRLLSHVIRGEPIEERAVVRAPVAAEADGTVTMRDLMRDAIVWREILRPPLVSRPARRLVER